MNNSNKIDRKNIQDILSLTPMQEGMLFHYLQAPKDTAYFNQLCIELKGDLSLEHFRDAWNFVIASNEMLRTVFRWENLEIPTQVVLKKHSLLMQFEDLSLIKEPLVRKKKWETIKYNDLNNQFDLRMVSFRVILGKMTKNHFYMLISNHHILYDGWSTGILLKEFFQAYESIKSRSVQMLPLIKTKFKEFIQWHFKQDKQEQKKYWQAYLDDFDSLTRLPVKISESMSGALGGRNYRLKLDQAIKEKLEIFVRNQRITLATLFYSAWSILLQKYCGTDDVVFGTTVSGRSVPIIDIENMVGLFINTIPLRIKIGSDQYLHDFLREINLQLTVREKYENTPLVDIYSYCRKHDHSGQELFDSVVSVENYPLDFSLIEDEAHLAVCSYSMEEMPHYDLAAIISIDLGINIDFIYKESAFHKDTILSLANHFSSILEYLEENASERISNVEMLSIEEKQQLLSCFNCKKITYPSTKTIHQLFMEQVGKTPDNTALVISIDRISNLESPIQKKGDSFSKCDSLGLSLPFDRGQFSYQELNKDAELLANVLVRKGVQEDSIVGIMMERSAALIIGILGILKAGGAYLPIDPDYPQERIYFMLNDSGANILLTGSEFSNIDTLPSLSEQLSVKSLFFEKVFWQQSEHGTLSLDVPFGEPEDGLKSVYRIPERSASVPSVAKKFLPVTGHRPPATSLAYIIYTSGSTGKPKGVMVNHNSVVNLISSQKQQFNIDLTDRILLFSSICFDASVEQIFLAFLSGASLVLVDKNMLLNLRQFEKFLEIQRITHLHAVPSFLININPNRQLKLKRIIAGGDVCPVQLVDRWSQFCDFYNEYGPTETTVTSIEVKFRGPEAVNKNRKSLPIGTPIANTLVVLMDSSMNPVPVGLVGELYIGGAGVGRGYMNHPELTADKFSFGQSRDSFRVKLPLNSSKNYFSPYSPVYKTGDLVRWLSDGNIEFISRLDYQVKIRGFRIELGEIEFHLVNFKRNPVPVTHVQCKSCLLNENYPGISFDEEGICNICREYETFKASVFDYFQEPEDLKKCIEKAASEKCSSYDCMLLFSGGKDSSYVLYRLVEMGLNVLAFTFDNGYISHTALENINRITTTLKVDSIVYKLDNMNEIFLESLNREHTVCDGCFKALTACSTYVASEKKINMIVTGLSRGQIFDTKLYALYKQNIFNVAEIDEKLLLSRKIYHSTPDKISQLLNITLSHEIFDGIHFVDFFRYENTSPEKIKEYLRERDTYWCRPCDTGFCSTNCIINDTGIYVHSRERGFHNYAAPLSWTYRLGQGNREELQEEIKFNVDQFKAQEILKEIGYREKPIRQAIVVDSQDEKGEKYLTAYYVSDREIEVTELRKYLAFVLPEYMIPSYFIRLEQMPLTHTGKLDRKSLPRPGVISQYDPIEPLNMNELKLVRLWTEILGIDSELLGYDSNFFDLGGHSLKAALLISRIQKAFGINIPLSQIFKSPTIRLLSEYISSSKINYGDTIYPLEKKEFYNLSSVQKRMFFIQQSDELSLAYHMVSVWHWKGTCDREQLHSVFYTMILRHESLRTSFPTVGGETVQRIHTEIDFSIEFYEVLSGEKVKSEIIHSFVRPFILTEAPLFRVGFVKLRETEFLFLVDFHHIIADGASIDILLNEFTSLYKHETLPQVELHYKEYCEWQFRSKKKDEIQWKKQENFWRNEFLGGIPVLGLPLDFSRNIPQGNKGDSLRFNCEELDTQKLHSLGLKFGATFYMVLTAVFNVFLAKLCQQEDIVVGMVTEGRTLSFFRSIVGMFVNTLAIRNFPMGEKSFISFLEEVREKTLLVLENQDYQLDELIENPNAGNKSVGVSPFSAMLVMENKSIGRMELKLPGSIMTPYEYDPGIAKFDLILIAEQEDNRIRFIFQYCTNLFMRETVERFSRHFKQLVTSIIENPEQRISELNMLSLQEKLQLLVEFNDTGDHLPNNKTIHGLFREQVKKTSDGVALTGQVADFEIPNSKQEPIQKGGKSYQPPETIGMVYLTYSELDSITDRLADRLIELGSRPNSIIAIKVDRTVEMIMGILGILKTGSAYLPIDPSSPDDRIDYMLTDSGAEICLTGNELFRLIDSPSFPSLSSVPSVAKIFLPATSLAYVIYTSGSTGKPKGVPITHSNFSQLIHWGYRQLGIGSNDRALQNLSYFFDWSVWEIFITLTTGASLYMVSKEMIMNPGKCIEFIRIHALTVLHITPSHCSYLVNTGKEMETLNYLIIGAEKLTYDLVKRSINAVNPSCRIFNMYGPTEATIISAVLEIDRTRVDEYKELSSVPIGSPSGNLFLWIVDKYLKLCPAKVAGELVIGGDSVAKGYLNNPELTSDRFLHPYVFTEIHQLILNTRPSYSPAYNHSFIHSTIYRTGDMARWLSDGRVEFLGRMDNQVKVRGYRLELGEIENHLLDYPGVKEAVVIVKEHQANEKYLCAYIVAGDDFDQFNLKNTLAGFLPDYMIPSYVMRMEKLPLNPNKKIDIKALPEPEKIPGIEYVAPQNSVEEQLVKIWGTILKTGIPIGIDDNFFELGGYSLKVMELVSRIHHCFEVKIPLTEIYENQTIRQLAHYIKHATTDRYFSINKVELKEYYMLSSPQRRLYVLQQMEQHETVYNLPSVWEIEGTIRIETLEESFKCLIQRHESLRTSFQSVNEEPIQRIHKTVGFSLEHFYASKSEPEANIENIIKKFIRAFDLSKAPLLRIGLIERDQNRQLLMIDIHHIISDGLSTHVLVNDFVQLLSKNASLAPLRLQYKDYSEWHNRQKKKEINVYTKQEQYWLSRFDENVPLLELPLDYPRNPIRSGDGCVMVSEVARPLVEKLKKFTKERQVTLFVVLLSVYTILLSKYTNKEDIIVGSPIAGRRHVDLENIIGLFVNMLAMRNFPSRNKTFAEFLDQVKLSANEAHENQDYPFEELLSRLGLQGDLSRTPLLDTVFQLMDIKLNKIVIPGQDHLPLILTPWEMQFQVSHFDLYFVVIEDENNIRLRIEYSTELFRSETIENIMEHFKEILGQVVEDYHILLKDIKLTHQLKEIELEFLDEYQEEF